MYAISFELKKEGPELHFRDPHKTVFDEIAEELRQYGFEKTVRGIYVNPSEQDALKDVYRAISALSNIERIKRSLQNLSVFKIED